MENIDKNYIKFTGAHIIDLELISHLMKLINVRNQILQNYRSGYMTQEQAIGQFTSITTNIEQLLNL